MPARRRRYASAEGRPQASPIAHLNFAPRYLEGILNVLGITDVTIVHGGGAKAVDLGETTMNGFVDAILPRAEHADAA